MNDKPASLPSNEQKWLADVERTARSVKRQNQCGANRAVELDADEVLKLVAGYRRSSDETSDDSELLEIVRIVSTMDCFYTGAKCSDENCGCLAARAERAVQAVEPSLKTPAERAIAAIAETIRGLTGERREAAVRILHNWNEMMRGMPASPLKANDE